MLSIRRFPPTPQLILSLVLFAIACLPAMAQVTVTDIGSINGRASVGIGVNHAGDVTGVSFFSGTIGTPNGPGSEPFLTHSVLFSKGALQDLGAIEGAEGCSPLGCQSEAFGINDSDWVVGWTDNGIHGTLPAIWVPAPVATLKKGINVLPALDANEGSIAISVNNVGQIVGFSKTGGFVPHAVLWQLDAGGPTLTELGTFRTDRLGGSIANSINDLGQIVGQAADANFVNHAFLYLPTPAYGLPAGLNNISSAEPFGASAAAINNRGQIAGDVFGVPFLWLPAPAYGLPAGFNKLAPESQKMLSFVPTSLSDSGVIVGQASILTNPATRESKTVSAAWRNGRWTFLNDLLPSTTPWDLASASAVTRIGKTTRITGFGILSGVTDINGLTPVGHGYVLNVTCTADVNDDGLVDDADVNLIRSQLGRTLPPGTGGDVNGDGIVNQQDLLLAGKQIHQPCL